MSKMSKKEVDSLLDIIFYILISPYLLINWIVNLCKGRKTKINNSKKINDKIKTIQTYSASITNWNLNGYISKIKKNIITQSSSHTIGFSESFLSFYTEQGHYSSIEYENIRLISLYVSSDNNKLIIQVQSSRIPFDVNHLNDAEELYKIIINIIAINKKLKENDINKVLTYNRPVSSFEKATALIKEKKDVINGFIDKYKDDIFALIESLDANVFSFNGCLYSSLVGNRISDIYVSNDGFYSNGYKSTDKSIEEVLFFAKGLKSRIQNIWEDKDSLDTIIYIVIKNVVIKYYANFYKSNYGQNTILEFCNAILEIKETELTLYKMAYICNYILDKDISLPIHTTYNKLSSEIGQTLFELKQQRKEAKLFRNSENPNSESVVNESSIKQTNVDTKVNIAITKDKEIALIDTIDQMSGEEFEKYIGNYFKNLGYKVIVTQLSGDFGVDIIIENEFVKIGVQAKRYTNTVGNSAIQEIVAGMKHYNLDKGMVITNNYFSRSAIELAKDNNIILWDRDTLIEKIKVK